MFSCRTFTQVSTQWQDTDTMREELDDLQVAALSLLFITASCYVGTLKSFLVICAPFIPFNLPISPL